MLKLYIFISFLLISQIFAKENKILESQPEILFEYKNLNIAQKKVALKVKFNNAVLYLEQKKYTKAIKLFKQTEKILKIPSFLNIGIAYYKLKSQNNAYLYLKKIYDIKEVANEDTYSYISAAYYLYKLTKNRKFMEEIINTIEKQENLSEHSKRLVVETYIELKEYKKALNILRKMEFPHNLKMALLYIKIKEYPNAVIYLEKALTTTTNDDIKNKILWIKAYANLKANNFKRLKDDIKDIQKRIRIYKTHLQMPIKLYFNKNKFLAKEYFDMVTKFDTNRKIDFIFYFAPYIFADNDEINFETNKAFMLKNKEDISDLDLMVEYNANFIKIIKKDPIKKALLLQQMMDKKYDTQSYEYYNLGLCYAQIDDFHKAYKYFNKAYSLNKGNNLYAAMVLLSANRVKLDMPKKERERIIGNILSLDGTYHYFGQYIYKIIFNDKHIPKEVKLTEEFKNSIFFRALYFLDYVDQKGIMKNEPLLVEFDKNPLVYLLKLIARENGESDYQYISRIQDNMPRKYNNLFIKGPLIITRYYIDILKAIGMFHVADLNIDTDTSPTYYRTKALVQLYNNNPSSTISLIEYLQDKYKIQDRYTYLLLTAALVDASKNKEATLALYEAQTILNNDADINFLIGIGFLNDLKLNSATKYFKYKYNNELIDFKLVGFDKFLEEI